MNVKSQSQSLPSGSPPAEQRTQASTSNREWLILAVLLIIGLALRLWATSDQSFTADEASELNTSLAPAGLLEMLDGARRFPFLYHLMLRGWLIVFPDLEFARWLSIIIGLATIVVMWRLSRRICGVAAGLATAGLASMSSLLVWYAIEVRMYGLFLLFAALTLLGFVRLLQEPSSANWAMYVAAGAGGLFTHYWFPLVLLTTAPFLLLSDAWRQHRRAATLAWASFAALVFPWAWSLAQDVGGNYGPAARAAFGVEGFVYTYFALVSGYTLGPSLSELHTLSLEKAIREFAPFLAIALPVVLVLGWAGFKRLQGSRWVTILLTLVLAPVLLVGIASAAGPLGFNVRYVSWILIPFYCWLGAGIANRRFRLLVIPSVVILLGLSSLALYNRTEVDRYRNEDAAAVAEYLQATASERELFVSVDYMARALVIYMPETWTIREVPTVSQKGSGLDLALESIQSGTGDSVWIAYTREFHGDRGGNFLDALIEMGAEHVQSFAGIDLYLLN